VSAPVYNFINCVVDVDCPVIVQFFLDYFGLKLHLCAVILQHPMYFVICHF
jgi:hypothetical protein